VSMRRCLTVSWGALSAKEPELLAGYLNSETNTQKFAADPISAIRATNLGFDDDSLQDLESQDWARVAKENRPSLPADLALALLMAKTAADEVAWINWRIPAVASCNTTSCNSR
jgi:hypothetical protein